MARNMKKIMLIPLIVIIKMLKYSAHAVTVASGIVFHLLGIIVLLTTVMCFVFRTENADVLKNMFLTGIVVYCLPLIGTVMTGVIAAIEEAIK